MLFIILNKNQNIIPITHNTLHILKTYNFPLEHRQSIQKAYKNQRKPSNGQSHEPSVYRHKHWFYHNPSRLFPAASIHNKRQLILYHHTRGSGAE